MTNEDQIDDQIYMITSAGIAKRKIIFVEHLNMHRKTK